jgi:hypothetical protein
LTKFGIFVSKTLDYIADPNHDRKIPSELFEIGHMMTKKLREANLLEFYGLLRFVNALKYHEKYHIGLEQSNTNIQRTMSVFEREKDNFN